MTTELKYETEPIKEETATEPKKKHRVSTSASEIEGETQLTDLHLDTYRIWTTRGFMRYDDWCFMTLGRIRMDPSRKAYMREIMISDNRYVCISEKGYVEPGSGDAGKDEEV